MYRITEKKAVCLLLLTLIYFETGYGLHLKWMTDTSKADVQNLPEASHRRQKREWFVPPIEVRENEDYSAKNTIAEIHSDFKDKKIAVLYKISGPGANEDPKGYFEMDSETGQLKICKIVDREQYPVFPLQAYAKDYRGEDLERILNLTIKIIDVNDNAPVFAKRIFNAEVEELSSILTLITTLHATDADEPNTLNTKLSYFVRHETKMFRVDEASGKIFPGNPYLDREKQAMYNLTVEVRDLAGDRFGNWDKAQLIIRVLDANDNIPFLDKENYEASVEENKANVEVLRIKAHDNDEEFTDNWLVNYTIISGNENGYFTIKTDPITNEGIVILNREVDYEELQNFLLGIVISNKAPYHPSLGKVGVQKPVPLNVKIINVPEGPIFRPKWKVIQVNEDKKTTTINTVVGTYQAVDEDSGLPVKNVTYAKLYDPDNWIDIDPSTAAIKLRKYPDRESPYVVNGTYNTTIVAISTDIPPKTATGTISLQVVDANDNCPQIDQTSLNICEDAQSINITATDLDGDPYAGPFSFKIIDEPEGTVQMWSVGETYGTSMQLVHSQHLWDKINYKVQIQVRDRQGRMCTEKQIVTLQTCKCIDGIHCTDYRKTSSIAFGGAAIGLMILGFLLLLLVPLLLLLCKSASAAAGQKFALIPDVPKESLLPWNKEGAVPQDMEQLSFSTSKFSDKSLQETRVDSDVHRTISKMESGAYVTNFAAKSYAGGRPQVKDDFFFTNGFNARQGTRLTEGSISKGYAERSVARGTLNESFLLKHFTEKACLFVEEDLRKPADNYTTVYCTEETHSPSGSVGCCSFIESNFEDGLLDDLGPKFKTLAEVCTGKEISTDVIINQTGLHQQHSNTSYQNLLPSSLSTSNGIGYYGSSLNKSPLSIHPVLSQSKPTMQTSRKSIAQMVSNSQSAESSSKIAIQNLMLPSHIMQVSQLTPESVFWQNVVDLDGFHGSGSNLRVIGTIPEAAVQQHVLVEHSLAPGTTI
ncbi:desmoglein-2-like [Protopterus annectens]|uniref:desmoglein-2-like n=1 Tax=Protopterus annectens TaxID=7888 RepID=UPI001CFB1C4C|nr:desmoglein-2-like [Protopterus annectens]